MTIKKNNLKNKGTKMAWFKLIVFLLSCVGISNILTRQYVFKWWRDWVYKTFPYNDTFNTLVNCPICVGFWVGFFVSLVWFPGLIVEPAFFNSVLCGASVSMVADITFSKIIPF